MVQLDFQVFSDKDVSQIPSIFISLMWDVKESTHYPKGVGREVASVVAVLCEWVKRR